MQAAVEPEAVAPPPQLADSQALPRGAGEASGALPLIAAGLLWCETQRRTSAMGSMRLPAEHITEDGTVWSVSSDDRTITIEARWQHYQMEQVRNLIPRRRDDLVNPSSRLKNRTDNLAAILRVPEDRRTEVQTADLARLESEIVEVTADIKRRKQEIEDLLAQAAAAKVDRWQFAVGGEFGCFIKSDLPSVIGDEPALGRHPLDQEDPADENDAGS